MSDPHPAATGPPPNPGFHPSNFSFLRKQAKALLRAYHAGDPAALLRISATCPQLRGKWNGVPRAEVGLVEAQFTLAREFGFASWPKLKASLEPQRHRQNSRPNRNGD